MVSKKVRNKHDWGGQKHGSGLCFSGKSKKVTIVRKGKFILSELCDLAKGISGREN